MSTITRLTPSCSQNIHALDSTGRVVGLVALLRGAMDQDQLANVKSPDSPCPNCQFGLYAQDEDAYVWNVDVSNQVLKEIDGSILTMDIHLQGQDLIGESFSIPIFGLNPTSQSSKQIYSYVMDVSIHQGLFALLDFLYWGIRWCDTMKNATTPIIRYRPWISISLCGLLPIQKHACVEVGHKVNCIGISMALLIKLDIGWCEPVGGLSVFASPSLNIQADDGKPVVVLAAAMDSRSMFHDLTIGTNTDVSGVVALLAVAEALSRVSNVLVLPIQSTETIFCYRYQQPIFQNTSSTRFLQLNLGDLQAPSDLYKTSAIHFHAPMHLVLSNVPFQTLHAPILVYALWNLQRSTWIISIPLSSSIRLPTPIAQGIGDMSMIPQ